MRRGSLEFAYGELLGANINRSPTSYLKNPAEERAQYVHDVDKEMTLLKVVDQESGRCSTPPKSSLYIILHPCVTIRATASDAGPLYLLQFIRYYPGTADHNQMAFWHPCRGRGSVSWFPVHCTSINNTNTLISGDNKGVAAQLMEKWALNSGNVSRGEFVGAFAQANVGDTSPNTQGAFCLDTGRH